MEDQQTICIQFEASADDIEMVTALFRRSDWIMDEVELIESLDLPGVYTWTRNVNKAQRIGVAYMIDGQITVLHQSEEEQDPAEPGAARGVDEIGWKFRVFKLTDEEDDQLLNILRERSWDIENHVVQREPEVEQGLAVPP